MKDKIEMLHELCETLTEELEEINEKIQKSDGMSAGDLEAVDKLSHALKSVKTTIAMMEADDDGYSGYYPRYYMGGSYAEDRNTMGGNRGGRSYARKRDSMGRYSRRGYSYAESMESLLDEMREMLPGMTEEKRRKAEELMTALR